MTDAYRRLLTVEVHTAGVQGDGGKLVLKASRARYPFVAHAFVGGG